MLKCDRVSFSIIQHNFQDEHAIECHTPGGIEVFSSIKVSDILSINPGRMNVLSSAVAKNNKETRFVYWKPKQLQGSK